MGLDSCDCRYESLVAPGIPVVPIILKSTPYDGLSTEAELLMRAVPHMQPHGLYHCVVCGRYIYGRADGPPLVLKECEPQGLGGASLEAPAP